MTLHVVRAGGSFGHRLFFEPGDRGRAGLEGDRPAGQADVDPQRRHAPRPHAPGQPPQGAGHPPARQRAHLRAPASRPCRSTSAHGLGEALTAAGFDVLSGGRDPDACSSSRQKVPVRLRRHDPAADRRAARVPDQQSGARSTPARPRPSNEIMVDEIAARAAARTRSRSGASSCASARPGPCSTRSPAPASGAARCRPAPRRASRSTRSTSASSPTSSRSTPATAAQPAGHQGRLRGRRRHGRSTRAGSRRRCRARSIDGLSMTLQAGLHIDNGAVREGSYTDFHFARMRHSPPRDRGPRHAADAASPAAPASSASRPPPRPSPTPTPGPPADRPRRFPIAG